MTSNGRRISSRRFSPSGGREAKTGKTSAIRRLALMQVVKTRYQDFLGSLFLATKLIWEIASHSLKDKTMTFS